MLEQTQEAKMAVAEALKRWRESKGLSVVEMSHYANTTPQTIYNAESGKCNTGKYVNLYVQEVLIGGYKDGDLERIS